MYTLNKSYINTKKMKTFTVQECSIGGQLSPSLTLQSQSSQAHMLNRFAFRFFLFFFFPPFLSSFLVSHEIHRGNVGENRYVFCLLDRRGFRDGSAQVSLLHVIVVGANDLLTL